MPFVLDASVALAWLFPDERHPVAEAALALMTEELPIVPAHWLLEMANGLVMAERRQRISASECADLWTKVTQLQVNIVPIDIGKTIFELSRQFRLTAYDALYLGLARAHRQPLATIDLPLANAALAERVELVGRQA